jgi:hypothetical protein
VLPRPLPWVVVAHSPTPSQVRIAASSKGEARKAEAAWDWWCSAKSTSPRKPSRLPIALGIQSFSLSQTGMDFVNDGSERGKVEM